MTTLHSNKYQGEDEIVLASLRLVLGLDSISKCIDKLDLHEY